MSLTVLYMLASVRPMISRYPSRNMAQWLPDPQGSTGPPLVREPEWKLLAVSWKPSRA